MRRLFVLPFALLLLSTVACFNLNQDGDEGIHIGDDLITITGNDYRESVECSGQDVVVSGLHNSIDLQGSCASLSVTGLGNDVQVDAVKVITVTGKNNRVAWEQGDGGRSPVVNNTGTNNLVERGE